jgi:hypothetical protein
MQIKTEDGQQIEVEDSLSGDTAWVSIFAEPSDEYGAQAGANLTSAEARRLVEHLRDLFGWVDLS